MGLAPKVNRQRCMVQRSGAGFYAAVLVAAASGRGCFAQERSLALAAEANVLSTARLRTQRVLISLKPADPCCRGRTNPREHLQVCPVTVALALQMSQAPFFKWDRRLAAWC